VLHVSFIVRCAELRKKDEGILISRFVSRAFVTHSCPICLSTTNCTAPTTNALTITAVYH